MFKLNPFSKQSNVKNDLLSGLTVALALVPEAVAFALVAQLNPLMGLYAAFLMALITASLGGRPGMISGATGALAVVMLALVVQHGAQYLLAAVVLMGLIQILMGLCQLGKFIRIVPYPVFLGFVNGLAIVIGLAQLEHFKIKASDGEYHWLPTTELGLMLGLVILTMFIIHFLPKLTKALPSTLVAILTITGISLLFKLDTRVVGDMAQIAGGLPQFSFPALPYTFETLKIILPYSCIFAAVGLIESLLTLELVDEVTQTKGQPNRECIAQGIANITCGHLGAMGGCAMVGQSIINVESGGRTRLSGIAAGLFLLSFILFAAPLIQLIPLAALIGVMFMVVIGTFEWGSLRAFGKVPHSDMFITVLVASVTVITDLAIAVVLGVIVSALIFSWDHAKQIHVQLMEEDDEHRVYMVHGPLFFASVRNFDEQFSPQKDPNDVTIDFAHSKVVDHSALEAIDRLADRYRKYGKTLHLKHLSTDCQQLLKKAGDLVEVNYSEDPHYHVMVNEKEI